MPAGAAVYRCELHINGRIIRAKVEDRQTAKEICREQKAAGRRTALVETERENLFTLSLGNVQPGDVIVVRFAWFQMLDRAGDGLRLLVPTCREFATSQANPSSVICQVAAQWTIRITPPRIDALHPDAAYPKSVIRIMASWISPR